VTTGIGSAPASARKPHTPASEIKIFSLSERIGRVRYLVYFLAAVLMCSTAFYVIYAAAHLLPPALGQLVAMLALVFTRYLMLPMILCVLTIRRLHDFNASGWWSLLLVVPLAVLVLLAIPGTKLDNRYGAPPPANGEFLNIAAVLGPLLLIGIAVQAYQRREAAQAPQRAPSYSAPANPSGKREPLRPYAR
jgi:uncharacterized membrane protein YhaH (DUF805 family)